MQREVDAQSLQTNQNGMEEPNILDEESASASPPDETFRLLPLFEKDMFDRLFIKKHSMNNNKALRCAWEQFKSTYGNKKGPSKMPDNDDLHFHNQMVRFYPTLAIKDKDHRKKMKSGPGVDVYGQKPIPNNLFMKRDGKVASTNHSTKVNAKQVGKPPKLKTVASKPEVRSATAKKAGKAT